MKIYLMPGDRLGVNSNNEHDDIVLRAETDDEDWMVVLSSKSRWMIVDAASITMDKPVAEPRTRAQRFADIVRLAFRRG